MIQFLKKVSTISLMLVLSAIMACSDDAEEVLEEIKEDIEEGQKVTTCDTPLYIEKGGFIKGDFEAISDLNGWELNKSIEGFEGTGYLVWKGADNFSTPGVAKLVYKIKITNPGTYQFVWKTKIAKGTSNTEHNDTWLRFPDADDFYGKKENSFVYPKGSGKTPAPNGSSKNGWFKVYMNHQDNWFWRANTSDHDPHNIFVEFKNSGTYTMEVSARSAYHGIDSFVLFQSTITSPTSADKPLSEMQCE